MNYSNSPMQGQGQCIGVPQNVASVKEASPLSIEIRKLQETVHVSESLTDELFKKLEPLIMQEPASPTSESKPPEVSLSLVPTNVRDQRIKLEGLNDALRTLLSTLQV